MNYIAQDSRINSHRIKNIKKQDLALNPFAAPFLWISEPDILLLTSGVQMKDGEAGKDVLAGNIEVMNTILHTAPVKKAVILAGLATLVDDSTARIQRRYTLPYHLYWFWGVIWIALVSFVY